MQYRYWESLRSQPLDPPAVRPSAVQVAVVHPAVPALPELDRLGPDEIAAPVLRPRRPRLAELGDELGEAAVELLALDGPALRRDGGGNLAVAGTCREVGVGVLSREPFDGPSDPDLAI